MALWGKEAIRRTIRSMLGIEIPAKNTRRRVAAIHTETRTSFGKVKKDIAELEGRLTGLKTTHASIQEKIDRQRAFLDQLATTAEQIHTNIQIHNEHLMQHASAIDDHGRKIAGHTESMSDHALTLQGVQERIAQLQTAVARFTQLPTAEREKPGRRQTELVSATKRKILQNMKGLVKRDILRVISESRAIPVTQLRHTFVEEKKVCSKASFFRYLKELRDENHIENESIEGQRVVQVSSEKKKERPTRAS